MKKLFSLMIGLTLIAGIAIIYNSCKKDEEKEPVKVKGCMDKDSKNYNSAAQIDDGSCRFEGSIVFWYNQTASEGLIADGAVSLTYYVDGQIVGSSAANVYFTSAPNCGQNGSITVTKDLGTSKSKTVTYSVKDQTGFEYWNGNLEFKANTCIATQLTW